MRVKIIETTDKNFLGLEFDSNDNPIVLSLNIKIHIDRIMPIQNGFRYISSSYIIDTKEI